VRDVKRLSATVDRDVTIDLVTMEHLQEMTTWESNGHVTVTLSDPERSKGRDPNTLRGQYLENVWR